jgi:hypothetical protein
MNKKLMLTLSAIVVIAIIVSVTIGFYFGQTIQRNAYLTVDVGTHSFHVTAYIQRVGDAEPIFWSYHAGVLTTIGKNWIEDQLGDSPSVDPTKWISLSTSASAPSAAWTQIPTEITTGGLARAAGTYASTGDGIWTISYQFTASETHTAVQLVGFQWAITPLDGDLAWSDTITPVTLNSGDKLTITGTTTVS